MTLSSKTKSEIKYLLPHEETKFRDYIVENLPINEWFWFTLLLETGLRLREALNLRIEDVLGKKYITIQTIKKGRARCIPISAVLKSSIDVYLDFKGNPTQGPLITTRHNRPYRDARPLQRRIKEIMTAIGRPDCSTHSLRHTFAKRILRKPHVNLPTVQYLLGHANLTNTAIYVQSGIEEAFEALDVALE